MLIFDTEERPHTSAADFRETNEKAEESGVLDVASVDGVEYPVEAKNRVYNHCCVVHPRTFVAKHVAEKGILCIWITETYNRQWASRQVNNDTLTPIHCKVPNGCKDWSA